MKIIIKIFVLFIFVLYLFIGIVYSGVRWTSNGVEICTAVNHQQSPSIVSDGSGGSIIVWQDYRGGSNYDIYAQKINSSGVVQWTANGIAICTAAGNQQFPTIVSDGGGGAIITWQDYRGGSNYDIYAQKINSSGVVQWTANGVAINTSAGDQQYPAIVSDGAGGAIITWQDYRTGTNYDIYNRRINSAGTAQGAVAGIAICTAAGDQQLPAIVSDGLGGAIITWQDYRSGSNYDIYSQRVDSAIAVQWLANGVVVCNAANDQKFPNIISNGAGGAIITWQDYISGSNWDIYVQNINSAGAVQWTANGEIICSAGNDQQNPAMVSDGTGGAIITWTDRRSGNNLDIYTQSINSAAVVQWTSNGVAICTAARDQQNPNLVADGAGGAVIKWEDYRNGSNYDIYSQRINSAGTIQWVSDGVVICDADNIQDSSAIAGDGAGGAIVAWEDYRSGSNWNIYSQRVANVAPSIINSIAPSSAFNHEPVEITNLSGTNFFTGLTVKLAKSGENDINAADIAVVDSTKVTCKFDITDKAVGFWDVILTNADGQINTLINGFEVKQSVISVDYTRDTTVAISATTGDVVLEIPANAFDKNISLSLDPSHPLPTTNQLEYRATNVRVDINASESNLKYQKPMTLTIGYRDSDISGMDENKLVIAFYNTNNNKWVSLPSKINADLNKISAKISHFSLYHVMEYSTAADLSNVKVYPNPYRPLSHAAANFTNLTPGAVIKIYSITGYKIAEITADSSGNAQWDGKNSGGNPIASGIYLCYISDGTNHRTVQIALER